VRLISVRLELKPAAQVVDSESIAASRRALDFRPGYAEAWNNIDTAYNKLGRYEEAVPACEQALRYKPDFELARNNLECARAKLKATAK
jgi:tetratricopeptide (TPR) repeat protein